MLFKKSLKIFLLDDDIFYMHIFQQHLANMGCHDISTFVDPLTCFDNLNPPPDIIFYDHGTDFLKGLDVLKMIKRHNPDIYLVFTCGPDEVESVIESLKFGAFDYFVKGDNDVKNIEMVLTKIHRVRELLHKNNSLQFKKINSYGL